MDTTFSATDEPPNDRPPKVAPESTTPGASRATEPRLWSTGIRASSSRVTLVADSVEYTSTRLTTCEPTTSIASRFTRQPPASRLTAVEIGKAACGERGGQYG